ncbi:MAG: major facilitator superfamily MFS 1 [Anaerolineales bacterium]|nr:major facilitator superfamily MFS 1 [Anaerolineales bacterium]MBM2847225.1 major facilitator superfamily 1 [Anaerolineales bacterium]
MVNPRVETPGVRSAKTPGVSEPSPWLVLALVCLPVFIGALDLTIVSAVLPTVIFELKIPVQTGLDDAAWIVSGYLLAYAVSMTFMGRVSDLLGRRRVFLICLGIFFLGSWWVAATEGTPAQLAFRLARLITGERPDRSMMALYALIAGRVVQAFGAGAIVPVSMALAGDLFPPARRALPLGLVGAVDTAGWVLGHLYGGIMVQYFRWQVLFWINLPIVALAFALIWWALRGLKQTLASGGVDWWGTALISLSLIGLNVGLAANESTTSSVALPDKSPPYAVPVLIGAAVAFLAFLWVERRSAAPLLNLQRFSDRNVRAATTTNLLVGFCLMVGLVSVPLLINAVGARTSEEGALVSGYLLSAFTIPMALAAIPGGLLAERLGFRWTTALGLALALAGFILMTRWQPEMARLAVEWVAALGSRTAPTPEMWQSLLRMIAGLLLAGVGLGVTIAPIGTAVINAVPDSERGIASALVIILRLIGMTVSVSGMTTFGVRREAALLKSALAGVPLTEAQKIGEVTQRVTTQVTSEMAWIAAGVCLLALIAALGLRARDRQRMQNE